MGVQMDTEVRETENVVIVGSGPAGYTAALYTSRADLDPLVIEGFAWGGLLQQTTDVENYPGYPEGVMGPQMMQDLRDQAARFGTRFITDDATKIDLADEPGGLHTVTVGGSEIKTRAVILAMGAEPKKLGVPGEDELAARGVSYCATCDAAFFRDHETLVVGGGDTAMEDATFLAKFAGKVSIVHRRDGFRASAIMLDRAKAMENIELVTPYVVERFEPGENGSLGKAVLENTEDGSHKEIPVTGAFVAIGHRPNSQLVADQLPVDDEGYLLVEGRSTKTSLPGVFAAGDLTDRVYRQAVTAAGTGCMAALDAEAYLRDTPIDPEAHWTPDPDRVEAAGQAAAESATAAAQPTAR
jgi:thioredoxin reductase (NADPH)